MLLSSVLFLFLFCFCLLFVCVCVLCVLFCFVKKVLCLGFLTWIIDLVTNTVLEELRVCTSTRLYYKIFGFIILNCKTVAKSTIYYYTARFSCLEFISTMLQDFRVCAILHDFHVYKSVLL